MRNSDAASRLQWCGNNEPHDRHEWIDRVTRRDCPGTASDAASVRDSELEHPEHLSDERLTEIVAASLVKWQAYPTIPGSLRWSRNGLTALHEMEARRNRV